MNEQGCRKFALVCHLARALVLAVFSLMVIPCVMKNFDSKIFAATFEINPSNETFTRDCATSVDILIRIFHNSNTSHI